jgi:hypothetical protein
MLQETTRSRPVMASSSQRREQNRQQPEQQQSFRTAFWRTVRTVFRIRRQEVRFKIRYFIIKFILLPPFFFVTKTSFLLTSLHKCWLLMTDGWNGSTGYIMTYRWCFQTAPSWSELITSIHSWCNYWPVSLPTMHSATGPSLVHLGDTVTPEMYFHCCWYVRCELERKWNEVTAAYWRSYQSLY